MNLEKAAIAASMSYKLRKEAFVSNLSGSSLTDVNLVTLVAASAVLLYTALQKRQSFHEAHPIIQYAIDFLLNVCAILFAFTAYASAPVFLNLLLATPAALLLLPIQPPRSSQKTKSKRKPDSSKHPHQSKGNINAKQNEHLATSEAITPLQTGRLVVRPFLTTYRGAMLIATAIAILAVDFSIFPRRFAKVETWGTSLMDLGVGSFVFSAGLVSARTILRGPQVQQTVAYTTRRMIQAFKHSIPLVVLGVARLISVKNLDYAEHVTEYGVHWNFFFTLALLAPFVETVDRLLALLGLSSPSVSTPNLNNPTNSTSKSPSATPTTNRKRSIRYDLVALLISISYEVILNNTSLLSFILISPRTPQSSLLVKNREGVFSFLGYLAIFLSGRSTGILTCQFHNIRTPATPRKGSSSSMFSHTVEVQRINQERRTVILPNLALRALVYATMYWAVSSVYTINLTVSRRLANLPYILWIAAFNNAQLLLFALIEAAGPPFIFTNAGKDNSTGGESKGAEEEEEGVLKAYQVPSRIMRAFNRNGLAVFLVANLLTGLVNLTVNTLDTSAAAAMAILMAYAAAVTGVALALDRLGIVVKM